MLDLSSTQPWRAVDSLQPDPSIDFEAAARDIARPSRLAPETIRHFEMLLESWADTASIANSVEMLGIFFNRFADRENYR